jgi:hypothetical protein
VSIAKLSSGMQNGPKKMLDRVAPWIMGTKAGQKPWVKDMG